MRFNRYFGLNGQGRMSRVGASPTYLIIHASPRRCSPFRAGSLRLRLSFRSNGTGDVVTYSCERAAVRGGECVEAVALHGLACDRAA